MLDPDELDACLVERPQNSVQFRLHCSTIAVLAVLDQEYGEEGQHSCRRVYDQLPGIRITQKRAATRPAQTRISTVEMTKASGCSMSRALPDAIQVGDSSIYTERCTRPERRRCAFLGWLFLNRNRRQLVERKLATSEIR